MCMCMRGRFVLVTMSAPACEHPHVRCVRVCACVCECVCNICSFCLVDVVAAAVCNIDRKFVVEACLGVVESISVCDHSPHSNSEHPCCTKLERRPHQCAGVGDVFHWKRASRSARAHTTDRQSCSARWCAKHATGKCATYCQIQRVCGRYRGKMRSLKKIP
jgi:hypothetical protein